MSLSGHYRNPIIPGFNPDPSLCHVSGQGFFLSTSTFEFFPGLPIYHSKDGLDWKLIGHALNRRSQGVDMRTVESSGGLWAPTIRYHQGKWYMVCSCFWRARVEGQPDLVSSGFYLTTDNIFDDDSWSNAIYFEETGFDQDLFFDDDGSAYHTVSRFNRKSIMADGKIRIESFINKIDLMTGRSLTEPVLAKASELGVAEGCHILKKDSFYYFFTAEGGTQDGHRECVYRSKSPLGPFEAPPDGVNPLIHNGNHPNVQNTGHMDLAEDDNGRWIAVFLAVRPVFDGRGRISDSLNGMQSHLGRETFLAPLEWVNGWPVVNGKKPIDLIGQGKGFEMLPEEKHWEDDFNNNQLQLGWYSLRTPLYPCYSLVERKGYLALRGSAATLDDDHCPSLLLRKQPFFDLDWVTELEFTPSRPEQEAGTVIWLTKNMYASLGVRRTQDGKMEIVHKHHSGTNTRNVQIFATNKALGTPVVMTITATRNNYQLSYLVQGDAEPTTVASISTDQFVPMFTGVQIGVYAQGSDDTPCINAAYFKYAKWDRE